MNLAKANRVLIIRLSSLGDIILTTPVLRAIKKKHPQLKIDFLCFKNFADVLNQNPNISSLITYNKKDNLLDLTKLLRQNEYDFIFDLHNNFRTNKILRVLKIPFHQYKKPNLAKFMLVNFKINLIKKIIPITDRYILGFNDIELDEGSAEIFIPENIMPQLSRNSEKHIAFCPGSKHFTKMWPKEYFIQLGNMLTAMGFKIVLLGGSSDRQICQEIYTQIAGSINLSNDDNLHLIAANLKECLVTVCNDSGMMHTSYSVGTPVISFFGSTVKELGFYPYKTKNLILENNSLNCRPCSHIGKNKCPKKHFKCMRDLTPELVIDDITQFINQQSN
ncbi:MAG: glycosyltransferase family 9 protein [Melioribacteraceae bacterium]|nr:glycosyltransferase family 9 protein [Melioribacteraceae bacterium]